MARVDGGLDGAQPVGIVAARPPAGGGAGIIEVPVPVRARLGALVLRRELAALADEDDALRLRIGGGDAPVGGIEQGLRLRVVRVDEGSTSLMKMTMASMPAWAIWERWASGKTSTPQPEWVMRGEKRLRRDSEP